MSSSHTHPPRTKVEAVSGMLLLLLLSLCGCSGAQPQTDSLPERNSGDVWAELRHLRDALVEQKTELTIARTELQSMKSRVEDLRVANAVLETRLSCSEREVGELKNHDEALRSRLVSVEHASERHQGNISATEARLSAGEGERAAFAARLAAAEAESAEQASEIASLLARTTSTEMRLSALEEEAAGRRKARVAFSADLGRSVGPLDAVGAVVYPNVNANVGKAYSPLTGAFTAPVRGVYYVRFTSMNAHAGNWVGLYLYKNGQQILYSGILNKDGGHLYASNALILHLEEGDVLETRLPLKHSLFDNGAKHNSFSGFLLFSM